MTLWQRLQAWYGPLTVRERILVVAAVILVFVMGGYTLLIDPLLKQRATQLRQLADVSRQNEEAAAQVAQLDAQLRVDPRADVEKALNDLDQQRQALDEQLSAQTVDLVAPQEMAKALGDALARRSGIRLVALSTLPVEPLLVTDDGAVTAATTGKAAGSATTETPTAEAMLYRHPIRLTLETGYFEARALVQAIESLPWRFYWRSLDYQVTTYPQGTLTLEIYTLSSSQDWLKGR